MKVVVTFGSVLGEVIASKRKELGLNQKSLAKGLEITQSCMSRLEIGRAAMTINQLRAVAKILHIKASALVQIAEEEAEKLEQVGVRIVSKPPKKFKKSPYLIDILK